MIKKTKSGYEVVSKETGRKMGSYKTRTEAEKRLAQVEMFKHMKQKPSKKK